MLFCFSNKILFIFVICFYTALYPVFYKGTIYERINEQTQEKQYVVLLSDFHFQSKDLNLPQVECVKKLLNTFGTLKAHNRVAFLIEDMASYEGDNKLVQVMNSKKSAYYLPDEKLNDIDGVDPMLSLVRAAKQLNFEAINLEYRFLRVYSISFAQPLLEKKFPNVDEANANVYRFDLTTKAMADETFTTLKNFHEDSESRKKKLLALSKNSQQAKDLEIIEKQWQSFKDTYENKVKEQHALLENYDGTLYQFLNEKIEPEKHSNFLGSLIMLDEDLFVIKALHGIANSNKKKIIIAAGGIHIRDIERVIEQMGFKWAGQDGKELNNITNDNVNKAEATRNENHTKFEEHLVAAKTVEDLKSILGEDVTLLSDDFFGYVAFLGENLNEEQ